MFLNIQVKPAADLSRLEEVLVVTEKQEQSAVADNGARVRAADILAQRLPSVPDKPPMVAATAKTVAPGQSASVVTKALTPAGNSVKPNVTQHPATASVAHVAGGDGATAAPASAGAANSDTRGESVTGSDAPVHAQTSDAPKKSAPKVSDGSESTGVSPNAAGANSADSPVTPAVSRPKPTVTQPNPVTEPKPTSLSRSLPSLSRSLPSLSRSLQSLSLPRNRRLRRIILTSVPITYTSGEQIEVYRFSIPVTVGVPLLALFLQAFVPRRLPFFSIFDLPLLVTIFFAMARRNPISGLLTGAAIRLGAGYVGRLSNRDLRHCENGGGIFCVVAGSEAGCGKCRRAVSSDIGILPGACGGLLHCGAGYGEHDAELELEPWNCGWTGECVSWRGTVFSAG